MKEKNGNGKQIAVRQPEPSVALILQEIVNRGITADNVGTVEKMVSLYERMEDRKAEQAFADAFNKLSKHMPEIEATKPVANKDGTVRFRYRPLHEIDKELRPFVLKFGFTYTFSEGPQSDGKVTKVCTIQHVGGHKRSNSFTVRSSTPPGSNASQGSMSDHTYAKRGALMDAFGIIVQHEDDAIMEGKPIGVDRGAELRQMVRESGSDETKFLQFAKAERYEDILDSKFDFLYDALEKRIRNGKPKPEKKSDEKRDPLTGEFEW